MSNLNNNQMDNNNINNNNINRKMSEYEKIVNECISKNQKYRDSEFVACDEFLHGNNPEYYQRFRNYSWKRPSQFLEEEKIKLFEGKIEPEDIL